MGAWQIFPHLLLAAESGVGGGKDNHADAAVKRWAVLVALALCAPVQAAPADGWISHPTAALVSGPVVLHFRHVLDLKKVPKALPVTVTADNRFILFVNGKRVATGPSTGTLAHWRTEGLDLAPYLKPGRNVVAAAVWDFVRR